MVWFLGPFCFLAKFLHLFFFSFGYYIQLIWFIRFFVFHTNTHTNWVKQARFREEYKTKCVQRHRFRLLVIVHSIIDCGHSIVYMISLKKFLNMKIIMHRILWLYYILISSEVGTRVIMSRHKTVKIWNATKLKCYMLCFFLLYPIFLYVVTYRNISYQKIGVCIMVYCRKYQENELYKETNEEK